jgi:hypothetical protein
VAVPQGIVDAFRAQWPRLLIVVHGDADRPVPSLYEYCEPEGLLFAFYYASNEVLKERSAAPLADLDKCYHWYGQREPQVQRFKVLEDYQAETWSRPRRISAKTEVNRYGTNRRCVVTNLSGHKQGIYHVFYVQRGGGRMARRSGVKSFG